MRRHFILYIKRQKAILSLLACFLFTGISAQAQVCAGDFYIDLYPTSAPCAPGYITMRADQMYTDPYISSGEFRWYNSATSTEILYSSYSYGDGSSSEFSMYATEGTTIYVCVYNYNLGCETPRVPYTVNFGTPLTGYVDYARMCRNNIGEIHVIGTGSGRFDLYKYNNGYEYVTTSYDGYFSVPNPETSPYRVYVYGGGGCNAVVPLDFFVEFNDQTTPTITGNTTVCEGRSTVLTANGGHNQYWWYDAGGNIVYEGYAFPTPTNLAPGTYTYTARGGSDYYCTGNGTSVTITVNPRPVDGVITASTTTACVGQTITIANQGGNGTPHYWGSSDGGQSWNLFADGHVGQSSFQFTPTTTGTYRFHVRNGTGCGFCWDQPGGCTTFPYVDIIVSNLPPSDGVITASTTTACVGETITIANQGGNGTPHYWGSSDGGQSWNLFEDAHVGQSSFQFTPTTTGTYRFHVRNKGGCGFCWDYPGGCTTFPYVDIVVSNPSPSITGGSSCMEGASLQLTSNLPGGTWSSSNTSIALVNANGMVAGVAPGTTTITYTITGSCGTFSSQLNFTVNSLSSVLTGLGKGIDDYPTTSVIPLVDGTVKTTEFIPDGGQSIAHTIKNVLALRVVEETGKYIPGDFTANVFLKVEYGHSSAPASICQINELKLSVNYTKDAGLKYDALNYFTFENAEFTRVTVLRTEAPQVVNGVAFDTKQVLELTNTLAGTRYYQLANNKKPDLDYVTPTPGTIPDALKVRWTVPANTYNNAVQLEWAWLEYDMEDIYKVGGVVNPDLLFKAGATRIDLTEGIVTGEYNIPLLYDGKGKLYMRARAINIMPSGSRSDGPWSNTISCPFDGHEDKLNWQATTSYAEEGKRKTVVQYYDGTLRPRQTVTKDNTTGQTVVAETMYDMEGRPAVQILPAPGINNIVAYTKNLNRFNGQPENLQPSDLDYYKTNPAEYFDFTTATSGYYATTSLNDTKEGAAKYYSSKNPDAIAGIHKNIPAANGYPYTVTRYTPDGTGRVMRQSGPGVSHKMESGHETLYFYGQPDQEELDALFGTEVGDRSHYFKNMVQDANGQMSVSYLDMQGRTIATALAGDSKLAALPGSGLSPGEDLIRNLLSKETNILKGNSIESISSILVPYSTEYRFAYKLNKQTITLPSCNGGTVTYDCKFDLQIAVTDETGEHDPVVFDHPAIDQIDLSQPVQLAVGSYSVRKTLTINQAWLQSLIAQYSADGVGVCNTLEELITTITDDDILTSGCDQPTTPLTSSNCMASLGDFNTYKNNYATSINVAVGNLTPEQVNDIRVQYDAAVAFCTSLDPTKSHTLATIRQQMLADMVPFTGQYAQQNGSGTIYNKYNIFSETGGAFSPQPYYKNPRNESPVGNNYYNDYGSVDQSIPAATLQGITKEEFAGAFKSSWGKALLKYHPEYSKLDYAEKNMPASFDFIDNLLSTTTPAYDPINSDDFFALPSQATNKSIIINYSNVSWPVAGNYSMWKLAYADAFGCKTIANGNQRDACINSMPAQFTATGTVVTVGSENKTLTAAMQAQAWNLYRGFYAQVRGEMVSRFINDMAGPNDNTAILAENYRLHFPATYAEEAQNNDWTELIPDAQGKYPAIDYNAVAAAYGHPCDSYINAWRQALLECPQLAARSDKEEILNSITSKMLEVCRNGTDGANPYGSSTVAPAYSNAAYTSFEQVINAVFQDKGISINQYCHPYGIEWPKQYGQNPRIAKQYISAVEPCTCTQWNKIIQEITQANHSTNTLDDINQYLSAIYKETITPELYNVLIQCGQSYPSCTVTQNPPPCPTCAAPPATDCIYLSSIPLLSPQPLPAFLVCGFDKSIAKCFNCTAFVNLQTDFVSIFNQEPDMSGAVPDEKVVWNDLFAKYVNYKTGLQHNWIYYANKFNANTCPIGGISGNAYQSDMSICREDKPLNDPTGPNPPSPCDAVRTGAKLKARLVYEYLKQHAMDDFKAAYQEKCVAVSELFTVKYAPKEYHYTLYYYDRAGNLVKTVPPKGVQPRYDALFLSEVKTERQKMQSGLPYTEKTPAHTLDTRYIYNSLNKVFMQKTPDAGISQFWYDQLGRPSASQNAKQALAGHVYSYTNYDEFGRVIQTSQLTSATQLTDPISKDKGALVNWYNSAYSSQNQIVQTTYDQEYGVINGYAFNQDNLRNRVSYTRVWNSIGDVYPASATYYNYDVHGNVGELLQDFGSVNGIANIMNQTGNQLKKIVYDYDLISGKVNQVSYQPGKSDAYYHRYEYDGENRLIDVYSGRDEVMLKLFREKEAHYDYYKHGPLASITLGKLMVQKQDYAYTLQGWLKGANPAFGGTLTNGTNTAEANPVAQDAFGFSLHYFDNDYIAIGYVAQSNSVLGNLGTSAVSLYNGNIAAMAVNIPKLGSPKVYNYHYDQLNRIVAMDAYNGLNISAGSFTPGNSLNEHKERISYDPNGNILSYLRNGDAARPLMDNLSYHYKPTNNQLHKVTDAELDVSAADYSKYNDIKQGQTDDNYVYDDIGNLITDNAEGITDIKWNIYGKIASINKSGVTKFVYDAFDNRILKETPTGSTAYVRDGSGNVLSVYTKSTTGNLTQSELHLYGSSRLGMVTPARVQDAIVPLSCGLTNGVNRTFTRGEKLFELSNHLGNVLVTVTDKRIAIPQAGNNTFIDHYEADIASAQDYYPFGMLQPGRKWNAGGYRYGFNGKENDNDVKGEGNQQDYGMRIYDPRLGKFLSVDPLTKGYPWYTPYQFAGNKPLWAVDLDGAEEKLSTDQLGRSLSITTVRSFWEVRNSITNSYMRVNHDLEYEMRTDMFQQFGISDPEVIKNYQLRMRTVEISSEEKICWPCKTGIETVKTYSREWVLEPVNSAGRELLEAAIDVVNIASTLSLAKMGSNGAPVLFAKGGGAFVLNSWRVSMSILYNVRRMASFGANKLALAGVHKFENIMEAGMAFVGKNARKIYGEERGRFIGWESEDGLKLFRPPMRKQAGEAEGLIQANFQQRTSTEYNWGSKSSDTKAHMSNTHVESDQMFNFNAERRNN